MTEPRPPWQPPEVITEQHVLQAVEVVHRAYAEPYIRQAMARSRALFMAGGLWMLALGWIFGLYFSSGAFPFAPIGVASAYSVYAIWLYRRAR